jgi:hypothetical protein
MEEAGDGEGGEGGSEMMLNEGGDGQRATRVRRNDTWNI